jgi:hypothetical protein
MQIKICTKCKVEKDYEDFRRDKNDKKSGRTLWCKKCLSHYRPVPATRKAYLERNKERIAQRQREHRANGYAEICKQRYHENKEKNLEKARAYSKKNRDKINKYVREHVAERKKTDHLFNLKVALRTLVGRSFKARKWKRTSRNEEILGIDFKTAKKHIERQFTKGMTWDNHGKGEGKWNIDHKIPLASAKNELELIALCHYTNLQPLWAIENIKKGKKILEMQIVMTI